jgi:hypothetical protein
MGDLARPAGLALEHAFVLAELLGLAEHQPRKQLEIEPHLAHPLSLRTGCGEDPRSRGWTHRRPRAHGYSELEVRILDGFETLAVALGVGIASGTRISCVAAFTSRLPAWE